jgi:hypothetical protein
MERGNITDQVRLQQVVAGASCVFHCAALVGPYHPHEAYTEVNYKGEDRAKFVDLSPAEFTPHLTAPSRICCVHLHPAPPYMVDRG